MTEYEICKEFVKYMKQLRERGHDIAFHHHYAEAVFRGNKKQVMGQVMKMKATGTSKGFPDYEIHIGEKILYIEVKTEKGRPSPEQKEWLSYLNERGKPATICYGLEQCKEEVNKYLKLE